MIAAQDVQRGIPESRITEIEAARRGKLPKLVGYNEVKSDLHTHTRASDGNNSIGEMAEAYQAVQFESLKRMYLEREKLVSISTQERRCFRLHPIPRGR